MTLTTTEELKHLASSDNANELTRRLARECLANREAQPVLYASEETLAYAKEGEKSLVTWTEPMGDAVIPLFTIPKAQTSGVVNLPTEFISDEGVMVRLEQVMAALALVGVKYERRGDACRAAMLQNSASGEPSIDAGLTADKRENSASVNQPVSSGYKLPDGWVACSERMPELDKRVLLYFGSYDGHIEDGCIGDDGDGPYHYFFDGDSLQQEPTHWMPLPAAPEGGNDHDTRR